jgi:hypothetical protein
VGLVTLATSLVLLQLPTSHADKATANPIKNRFKIAPLFYLSGNNEDCTGEHRETCPAGVAPKGA